MMVSRTSSSLHYSFNSDHRRCATFYQQKRDFPGQPNSKTRKHRFFAPPRPETSDAAPPWRALSGYGAIDPGEINSNNRGNQPPSASHGSIASKTKLWCRFWPIFLIHLVVCPGRNARFLQAQPFRNHIPSKHVLFALPTANQLGTISTNQHRGGTR